MTGSNVWESDPKLWESDSKLWESTLKIAPKMTITTAILTPYERPYDRATVARTAPGRESQMSDAILGIDGAHPAGLNTAFSEKRAAGAQASGRTVLRAGLPLKATPGRAIRVGVLTKKRGRWCVLGVLVRRVDRGSLLGAFLLASDARDQTEAESDGDSRECALPTPCARFA